MTPEELAHIHALCFTTPRPWTALEFRGLKVSRGIIIVEETGGFLIGRVAADEAEILTLAVHPDHRRKGIAARLLRDFEASATRQDAAHFILEVNVTNEPAIALYRSHGYTSVGIRKDYYAPKGGKKSSAIVMKKEARCPDYPHSPRI